MERLAHLVYITRELSGRWTIPILLQLEETGGRFTPLKNKLQISPSRLSNNIKIMTESGLIHYIPPHERHHPLLPEYRLTEKGQLMKEAAKVLEEAETKLNRGFLAAKKWNWPILVTISNGQNRFNEIRATLDTATPKIVSTRLSELNEMELVDKKLLIEEKPKHIYTLNQLTAPILEVTNQNLLTIF